jgi:hypothetical protein
VAAMITIMGGWGKSLFSDEQVWGRSEDPQEVQIEEYRSWSRGSWEPGAHNSRREPPPEAEGPQHVK